MKNKLIYPFLLFPIVYLSVIFIYSRNIPLGDDYEAILNFFTNFAHNKSSLFDQFFGHFIVVYRVVHLLILKITGHIDFRFVVIFWNILFAGVVVLFFSQQKKWNLAIIVIPIVFSLQYYITSIWAVLFLSNVVLAILAFVFAFSTKNYLRFLAYFIAVVSVFSSGNGIAVPIAITVITLLVNKEKNEKIFWSIVTFFLLLIYFIYFKVDMVQGIEENRLLDMDVHSFLRFLGLFFASLTSGLLLGYSEVGLWCCIIIGIISCVYLIVLLKKKYHKENPLFFTAIIFLLLTYAIIAIARRNYGLSVAYVPRYKVYSVIYIALIVYSFLEVYKLKRALRFVFLGASISLCFLSYVFMFHRLNQFAEKADFGAFLYTQNLSSNHLSHHIQSRRERILNEASKAEIFTYPSTPNIYNSKKISDISLPKYETKNLYSELTTNSQNDDLIYIEVATKQDSRLLAIDSEIYFQLEQDSVSITFKSKLHKYVYFYPRSSENKYYSYILLPKEILSSGLYRLRIIVIDGDYTRYKEVGVVKI